MPGRRPSQLCVGERALLHPCLFVRGRTYACGSVWAYAPACARHLRDGTAGCATIAQEEDYQIVEDTKSRNFLRKLPKKNKIP